MTTGESNENDPVYSADGKRLYFTSDRKGPENIFSLELATGRLLQYTDVVSGAFMPTLLRDPEGNGKDRLVFGGYWKQSFDLYVANVDEPVHEPQTVQIPVEPAQPKDLPRYEPDIQVTLDPANTSKYSGRKFFLEDAQSYIGVNSDQSYLGRIAFSFSDYLGNHRIFANLSSIDSLSNFDITYVDLTHRWYWEAETFDTRTYYYTGGDPLLNRGQQGRVTYQATGAVATIGYPFTFYHRAELGIGYIYRKDAIPVGDPFNPDFIEFTDNFPVIQGAVVGDSAVYANYGAVSGRRWRLGAAYAPKGGTLFDAVDIDARQYIPVTLRSNLALRVFAGASGGNRPSPFFFGGLDTLRGVDFRTLAGDRAFFANLEYRFPLIEAIATPLIVFRGIRGVIFFDVGGAWYNQLGQPFRFYNGDTKRLQDAIASYGWGFTVNLFGLDLNWDFARRFDLKQSGNFRSSFWIGTRF